MKINFLLGSDRRLTIMALYKYFSRANSSSLPDPSGPLSAKMPSSSISAANKMVQPILDRLKDGATSTTTRKKHGHYKHFSAEEKARIAKRAAECGVINTVRYYSKEFSDQSLSECTVRTWVKQYKSELRSRKQDSKDMTIKTLVLQRGL